MASNELAGGDRINLILSRRFDIQGAPAPFMASEVFPQLVLENDRPEWEWLGLGRLCSAVLFEGAGAGNFSIFGIHNPLGSGTLAVIKRWWINGETTGGAQQTGGMGISRTTAWGTFDKRGNFRDSRAGFVAGRQSTCRLIDTLSAAFNLEAVMDEWVLEVGARYESTTPFVLAPGGVLMWGNDSQNRPLWGGIEWTERRAEESELLGGFLGV